MACKFAGNLIFVEIFWKFPEILLLATVMTDNVNMHTAPAHLGYVPTEPIGLTMSAMRRYKPQTEYREVETRKLSDNDN